MFSSGGTTDDSQQEIIKDEKFYSRLLSKEISATTNPSFHVYYGVASGAVPFLWESHPGTPKHTMATTTLTPPLTPPPSYYFNSSKISNKSFAKSSKRSLMRAIFPILALRKPHGSQPSMSSSGRSSWDEEDQNDEAKMSPTSTLCFGERLAFKKALLSIVGHRSA